VNSNLPTFFLGEATQREIVKLDKALQQSPGRIDFDCQPALGEIDLNHVRTFRETPPDLPFMLAQQIVDKFLPSVAGKILRRVHQAQGRG
jgi:hypothetical protein